MRLFVDAHEGGKHLLAEAVEQKRRFAIEALAAARANELREEAARALGVEDHGRLPRGESPAAEPPHRALARARADLAHGLELLAVTRHRVPVIALHAVTVAGDDRATHAVARARIGADEAVAVAVHAITAVTRHARAFRIGDARIHRARRRFALQRELDRALGGDVPRVIEIEIGDRACHERRVGEARAIVLCGVTRDIAGRAHRLLDGLRRIIRRAGRTLALPEIHGDAETLVAVVLDRLDLAEPHGHRKTALRAHAGLGRACTLARGRVEYRGDHRLQFAAALHRRLFIRSHSSLPFRRAV